MSDITPEAAELAADPEDGIEFARFVVSEARQRGHIHVPLEVAEILLAELVKTQRAAETLGRIVERQGGDICRVAGVPMPEGGDADYQTAWERAFDMAAELVKVQKLERGRNARAEFLDAQFDKFHADLIDALPEDAVDDEMEPREVVDAVRVLAAELAEANRKLAEAWEEGRTVGSSRAMRHMSDEPGLDLRSGANPYRAALDGDHEQPKPEAEPIEVGEVVWTDGWS